MLSRPSVGLSALNRDPRGDGSSRKPPGGNGGDQHRAEHAEHPVGCAEFGERRVIDTPISEAGIIGLGVGAAATGCRPIIDLMFMDFLGECMDEVANQMAKMRFMFGGAAQLPITVLTMAGAGLNLAAQHSQSLEAWLCHLPGLKVMMPATPYDAKGSIIAAARDSNPVFVILNKMSLGLPGEVPEDPYEVPIGVANIVRPGTNFTIVAFGRMLHEALTAAEDLKADGIDTEVIDPITLQPFDTDTVIDSVKKTHRAMIVHEAVRFAGFGAEIAAQIQELAFDYLDANWIVPPAEKEDDFFPLAYWFLDAYHCQIEPLHGYTPTWDRSPEDFLAVAKHDVC